MSDISKEIKILNVYDKNGESLTTLIQEWLNKSKCKN